MSEWRCLTCGHPLQEGEDCPMPQCVENRQKARQAMGIEAQAQRPRVIRVRVQYTETFNEEDLKAFCRYHGLDPKRRREVRESILANLMNIGSMGVEEQVHEGYMGLEGDRMKEDVDTDQ